MGVPGAGKGKQSELLSQKTGFAIYSTGAELRSIAKVGGALGDKIGEVMRSGGLMPAWLASFLFQRSLIFLEPEEGIIYEGVGRKRAEAELFAEVCDWIGRDFRVLHLNVSEDSSRERLGKRHKLEGREDDHPETITRRFEHFHAETVPSLEYFRSIGKVMEIDGEPLPDAVFKEVCEKLGIN